MLSFENKPVKNWSLAEAKEYCETKLKDEDCEAMEETELCGYCKLAKYNICCNEPKYFNFNEIPKFTPDEIAFCRLVKKTFPWCNYVVRSPFALEFTEFRPLLTEFGNIEEDSVGRYFTIEYYFLPQIKRSTYYDIDNIIKQGENNERN